MASDERHTMCEIARYALGIVGATTASRRSERSEEWSDSGTPKSPTVFCDSKKAERPKKAKTHSTLLIVHSFSPLNKVREFVDIEL